MGGLHCIASASLTSLAYPQADCVEAARLVVLGVSADGQVESAVGGERRGARRRRQLADGAVAGHARGQAGGDEQEHFRSHRDRRNKLVSLGGDRTFRLCLSLGDSYPLSPPSSPLLRLLLLSPQSHLLRDLFVAKAFGVSAEPQPAAKAHRIHCSIMS